MGIFDDFVRNEKKKPKLRIKKMESWGGLYPKGDPRWNLKGTGGLDPKDTKYPMSSMNSMPIGLINKITRVPLKKK